MGVPAGRRSNWAPYFSVLATGDSNSLGGGQNSGWVSYESVVGGANLEKVSRLSDLGLQYLGGGTFSNESGIGNTTFQNLGITGHCIGGATHSRLWTSLVTSPKHPSDTAASLACPD